MEEHGGQEPVDRDQLADELRQIMGLRSRSSIRDRRWAEFEKLLDPDVRESRDARYAATERLIDSAIAEIHDHSHRTAAQALLGSGDGRWRTVTLRGSEAAGAFGNGWDAYRRRRANGSSQLSDTLDALASALTSTTSTTEIAETSTPRADTSAPGHQAVEQAVDDRAPRQQITAVVIDDGDAASAPSTDRDDPEDAPRTKSKRRLVVAVGIAALLTVTGARLVNAMNDRGGRRTGATTGEETICTLLKSEVGALPPDVDADQRQWAARFKDFARTLPPESVRCAGTIEWVQGVVIQPVAEPKPLGIGAIVAADEPGAEPLYMNYLEYQTYRYNLSTYGAEMIGKPVAGQDRGDATLVTLTRSTLVSQAPPVSFMLTGTFWETWIKRGGMNSDMGLPVSLARDMGSERVQDFEKGRLIIDLADPSENRWEPFANPAAALPADIHGSLLSAEDGTSWYVDADLTRHWVPTPHDFRCTAGLTATTHSGVPAQAIATLPAGDPIRCR